VGDRSARSAGRSPTCFLLEIQEPHTGQTGPGRARLEAAHFEEADGARLDTVGRAEFLPRGKALPPLRHRADGWREVRVKALNHKVTVTVDGVMLARFDRNIHQPFGDGEAELSPRGALGIWACQGGGFFRDAFSTVLPGEQAP
jgi:hypothetical protein